MTKLQENKKNNKPVFEIIAYILLALLLLLIYLCNREIIFIQDDLWYWTNLITGARISSVKDIVQSQIWHYFNWGGRTVAHSLLQFLLWGGGTFSNIANTLTFAILAVLMGKSGRKWNPWMVLLAGSMTVVYNPNIQDSMFWQSGCANYLYMTLLDLAFVWMYLKDIDLKDDKDSIPVNILKTIGVFLFGLLAGWTNENMGPTVFLLSLAVIITRSRRKSGVKPWMIAGSISSALGSAFMILAPGNFVRKDTILSLGSWKLDLCKRVFDYFRSIFEFFLITLLITAFIYVMYRLVLKRFPDLQTNLILLSGIVAILALAASPHVPERAIFGAMCFMIWGSSRMLTEIFGETKNEHYRIMITVLISCSSLYKLFFFWAQRVGWYR